MKLDKYIILAEIKDEDRYLVGYESGRIGYVTGEFERDAGVDLHSDWKVIKAIESTKIYFPTDEFGQMEVEIKTLTSLSIGFRFRGAYVPQIKCWVYVQGSYKRLTAKS